MKILGIETSCDECAAAVVRDGKTILSDCVASQIDIHRPYYGVVPEIASRKHTEWITPVVTEALERAHLSVHDIDGIAVTYRPGLIGSLLVGLSYAKGLAAACGIPFVGVDHIYAHLYAPHLEKDIPYPYIGLLVSGGHTIIALVEGYDSFSVLGTTIDDACGEAFDKVAKYYDLGYPGGVVIDKLAQKGNPDAFSFPKPSLHKGDHSYDVSYSGLKTAVVNQLDQFLNAGYEKTPENIAASFQKTAIDIIVSRVKRVVADTGLATVVAGGGVSANSYLRKRLGAEEGIESVFPSPRLCTDNAAMVAGLGYRYLEAGRRDSFDLNAEARVPLFRKTYP
ncbi:MAG: tRNA (adenosine(37)-N6)-threonylcarbamoyltransferase complex transferase subunit TsaD [Spirochaetales bacterium]|nr:tRNA (adenosine(37)-N6)-threonylcarbamoyltransferase complex transferase subunit TsaD [Spirochaetales bacterium]